MGTQLPLVEIIKQHITKHAINFLLFGMAMVIFMIINPVVQPASAQAGKAGIKIGTFDSRVIALAWSRSEAFKAHMVRINQESEAAEKAKDSTKLKELSVSMMSFQHLLHQMVFSNASAGFVMAVVRDKLPELAKKEGVTMIVSKWELPFADASVQAVDLSMKVAALFNASEDISKMAGEIAGQEPVPLDEMDIDGDMLDLYCRRFGK